MPDLSTTPPKRTAAGTTFIEFGTGEPIIIFVHGVGMNRNVWEPQLLHFSKAGRTIAYDILGHGGSPLPSNHASLEDYAEQLLRFFDDLGINQAAVVGHSMGALIALDFALQNPDRVTALIALNAVYKRTPNQQAAVAERANQLKSDSVSRVQEQTLNRWFDRTQLTQQAQSIANIRNWLAKANSIGYAKTYEVFSEADRLFVGRLNTLHMPALFVTGELDPNSTPEMSRQLAKESPKATSVVVPGERHMMAYVAAETVNPILTEFLNAPLDFAYDNESSPVAART